MLIDKRIEVVNGLQRAVFLKSSQGWKPEWLWLGALKAARFSDHAWPVLGRFAPHHAAQYDWLTSQGALFAGTAQIEQVTAVWSVRVLPDEERGGFVVETSFTPDQPLPLEAAAPLIDVKSPQHALTLELDECDLGACVVGRDSSFALSHPPLLCEPHREYYQRWRIGIRESIIENRKS